MNFSNNMMGVVAPIVTGLVLLGGIAAFVLLLGRIEPLPGPAAPRCMEG